LFEIPDQWKLNSTCSTTLLSTEQLLQLLCRLFYEAWDFVFENQRRRREGGGEGIERSRRKVGEKEEESRGGIGQVRELKMKKK